jgi:hypothetical protein
VATKPARLARDLGIGLLGLALGAGVAVAVANAGAPERDDAVVRTLELPGQPEAPAPAAPSAGPPVRAGSARAALHARLAAQVAGDQQTAWALLDRAGRTRWASVAAWAASQPDRLQPTGFRLGAERAAGRDSVDVTVSLTYRPGIDPFTGLTPGRTEEVWRAVREQGSWHVPADPVSRTPVLPADGAAPAAVQAWVERLLACDQAGAAALQAVPELYGPADLAGVPCQERGRWSVANAAGFDSAAEPEPFVDAFGPEVRGWARLVSVKGPRTSYAVVVAPVGDGWRVLGTSPQQPSG